MSVRNCAFSLFVTWHVHFMLIMHSTIHTIHRHCYLYCNVCFLKGQVEFHCYDKTRSIIRYSFIDTSAATLWDGCRCSVNCCHRRTFYGSTHFTYLSVFLLRLHSMALPYILYVAILLITCASSKRFNLVDKPEGKTCVGIREHAE